VSPTPVKQTLVIEKIVFGGEGLGQVGGKACFVPDVAAGEKVEVEIIQDKKNFFKARLLRVIEPSPNRIAPACSYVPRCGGCQYQHMTYAEELASKDAQVREIFKKELGLGAEVIRPIEASPGPERYRTSVTLHSEKLKGGRGYSWGFFSRDNLTLVPVKDCLIADEAFRPILASISGVPPKEKDVSFKLGEGGKPVSGAEERFYKVNLAGQTLMANSKGFFQTNAAVTEKIVRDLKAAVDEAVPAVFLDLYGGVGTFSVLCATQIPKIAVFEESPYSLSALKMNKANHALAQLEIVEGRAERTFGPYWDAANPQKAFICLDPPRQGIAPGLAAKLASVNAEVIAYLSCDPATLVRDLKVLLAGGRFEMRSVRAYDMFPRTSHIEILTILTKKR
jgi:tRNA/tmRNA/rRNA uracil-C5-methylase (TrmA/RlmC/RlmD family)